MLDESEALSRIVASVSPGPMTWVPIELGLGKVLARDVIGAVDSPPFDNSSMDGYAVRAAEAKAGATIRVSAEEQAAGPDLGLSLREGEAIRIFTGAPMPDGADAVIMQEDVNRDGDVIEILEGVESGEFIRRQGGDVCAGQRILSQGDEITPARIALLASQGISEIPVHTTPLAQIVTTGDELVSPGVSLLPGEIYNSNGPLLQTAVMDAGGTGARSHAMDDPKELAEVLREAFRVADMVIIAGGVSVGERDYVKEVLTDIGVEMDFWRIRLKPGKPFLFGCHPDGPVVFGLPGNPVSAFVTFSLFVRPVIRRLLGFPEEQTSLEKVHAIAGEEIGNRGDRPHYLRGFLKDGVFRLSGSQQSHAVFGLSRANCLVRLEPEETVESGGDVDCFRL